MTATTPLASEFPQATREQWLKLVEGVLKGASFDRLISTTSDGLRIEPLPPAAQGARAIAGRAPGSPWQVMQRVDHPDAAEANAQALRDLENGATGLSLVFAGSVTARGFGLEPSAAALERTLQDIHLDAGIAIEFEIGPQSREAISDFGALLARRNIPPSRVNLRCGMDPLGATATWGASPYAWNEIAGAVSGAVRRLSAAGFRGPFVAADGRVIHDAGGSEAQELAFVLGCAVQYLRAMEAWGTKPDEARHLIFARMSADADQFLTLAKFRALRKLWARVEQACGLTPQPLFIAAETSWRMLTQRDAAVNMLRATTATFSAGLGGADSISVLPHSLALGLPDEFARRIARNTQLVLIEESHLARVSDPAAGSGIIEQLTSGLCEAAWGLFQEIERSGGLFAALERNLVQDKVKAVRDQRNKRIAERRDALTGTSEFPNLAESTTAILDAKPVTLPAYAGGQIKSRFTPVVPHRLATPFEALRDRSDKILKSTGKRPRIFLANLGSAADFTPRAQFAKSLFEAGGIETLDNEGFKKRDALIKAFKASKADMACLCSTDHVYSHIAEDAVAALVKAGAKAVYFAGHPRDLKDRYTAAGVTEFVFVGCDAVTTLTGVYDRISE